MSNKIWNALKFADDALVGMANKAVHAWNWTTGGTKADLACLMQSAASIIETVGISSEEGLQAGLIFGPLALAGAHYFQSKFRETEKGEQSASEKGMKNLQAERDKDIFYAGVGPTLPLGFALMDYNDNKSLGFASAGESLRGASCYIMRADILSPRKNCVSRGLDKISEIVNSYKPQPALMPALAR